MWMLDLTPLVMRPSRHISLIIAVDNLCSLSRQSSFSAHLPSLSTFNKENRPLEKSDASNATCQVLSSRNMSIMARICICMFRLRNINRVPNVNQNISVCNQPLASHPARIRIPLAVLQIVFLQVILPLPAHHCDPVGFGLTVSDLPLSKRD